MSHVLKLIVGLDKDAMGVDVKRRWATKVLKGE